VLRRKKRLPRHIQARETRFGVKNAFLGYHIAAAARKVNAPGLPGGIFTLEANANRSMIVFFSPFRSDGKAVAAEWGKDGLLRGPFFLAWNLTISRASWGD